MKKQWIVVSMLVCVLVLLQGCYAPSPPPGGTTQTEFAVQIGVDKQMYKVGELVVFTVQVSQDCYLTLYNTSSEGEVTQIFPNKFAQDNFIRKGYQYRIPDYSDSFDFEVTGPAGIEKVRAIATAENVNLVEEEKIDRTEEFPRIYQERSGEFEKSVDEKLQVIPSERWAEASVTFQIVP
jgi:hypothetical protein